MPLFIAVTGHINAPPAYEKGAEKPLAQPLHHASSDQPPIQRGSSVLRHILFRACGQIGHQFVQFASFPHFHHNVAAADKFALNI